VSKSINVQFHMLPEEIANFAAGVSNTLKLDIELEKLTSRSVTKLPRDGDLKAALISQMPATDRIWFVTDSVDPDQIERFMLNVGRQKGDQLAQSQLGAGAKSARGHALLKKLAAELTAQTKDGCWVVSEAGNIGMSKMSRLSEGAIKASRAGKLVLRSAIFTQYYSIDKPNEG
jgi:hypothetical protein